MRSPSPNGSRLKTATKKPKVPDTMRKTKPTSKLSSNPTSTPPNADVRTGENLEYLEPAHVEEENHVPARIEFHPLLDADETMNTDFLKPAR